MSKNNFYAVIVGRMPGIYTSYSDCNKQVSGFSGNKFKGFNTLEEATAYFNENFKKPKNKKSSKKTKSVISYSVDFLNASQLMIYNEMCKDANIFITGDAGTGKSFLINTFIAEQRKLNKNVIICAPTGVAAINIGGTTIHKTFKIGRDNSIIKPDEKIYKVDNIFGKVDVIIIDEISMCRFDLFSYVVKYIKAAEKKYDKKIKLIVIGDFSQLPPVITNKDRAILQPLWEKLIPDIGGGFAFLAPQWAEMKFKTFKLNEVIRQNDKVFIDALSNLKSDNSAILSYFNKTAKKYSDKLNINAIHLCGTNAAAKEINDAKLRKISSKSKTYEGFVSGEFDPSECLAEKKIVLKIGVRVMSLVNDSMGRYQNGSLGTVTKLFSNSVMVEFDNGTTCEINETTWSSYRYELNAEMQLTQHVTGTFTQIPLKIAYAITIHKSQGQTYDSVIVDPNCFAHGQLYVALSRVKDIKNMYLTQNIKPSSLIVDKAVIDFNNSIKCA